MFVWSSIAHLIALTSPGPDTAVKQEFLQCCGTWVAVFGRFDQRRSESVGQAHSLEGIAISICLVHPRQRVVKGLEYHHQNTHKQDQHGHAGRVLNVRVGAKCASDWLEESVREEEGDDHLCAY